MIFIVCFDNFDLNLKMKMLIVQSKEYMFHAAGKRLFRNGKTGRQTFFPRESFPFPRLDSCLAKGSKGRKSRWGKRKALYEKKEPEFFISDHNLFLLHGYIFSGLDP